MGSDGADQAFAPPRARNPQRFIGKLPYTNNVSDWWTKAVGGWGDKPPLEPNMSTVGEVEPDGPKGRRTRRGLF